MGQGSQLSSMLTLVPPKALFAMCKLHVPIQVKVVLSIVSNDSNRFLSNFLFTLVPSIPILSNIGSPSHIYS